LANGKDIKTIKVAGKTYAVGLFWQPVQDEKNYLNEIKETVQNVVTGANLYCLKKGATTQYGLGYSSMGHKSGMPSGASAIASALRDKSSAVCAFKINEGWWFITIRNSLILSEEDAVYTNEQDAKDAFESMLAIPDWGYKIAPTDWGFEDTTEISAEELLGRGQAVELKKIQDNTKGYLIFLIIVAFAGWQYYQKQQEKQEMARRLAEKKRREEEAKKLNPPPPPPPPPAPWESLTDAEDMAKKCTILIVNSTVAIPGWELGDTVCTEKQLDTTWKRTYGSAGWVFEAQKFGYLPEKMELNSNDSSYNSIRGRLQIPVMKHRESKPLLMKAELQQKLNGIFQSLKIDGLKLEDKKITVKDPKNSSYSKDYPYTAFKFVDNASRIPLDWVKMFSTIDGVEIDSISWDNKKHIWSYSGKIYETTPQMQKDEAVEAQKLAAEEAKKAEEEAKKAEEEAKKAQEEADKIMQEAMKKAEEAKAAAEKKKAETQALGEKARELQENIKKANEERNSKAKIRK